MPHTNPGFDIESRDDLGQVVRYIEVKSTGEAWGDRGVALSNVQYECARERGAVYWLYVVVRPHDQDYLISRIQSPAERVAQYVFDGGWSDVAE